MTKTARKKAAAALKRGTKKKKATPSGNGDTQTIARGEVAYPQVNILPLFDPKYNPKVGQGSLTADKAKELLGWEEETDTAKFGSDYFCKDRYGKKVRCYNCTDNRYFQPGLAKDWMMSLLGGFWRFNGETGIIDRLAQVQDFQHRLVGLIWAVQEWEQHPEQYPYWGDSEPVMDCIVVVGISEDRQTINTINTGRRRTLADAIYRSHYFTGMTAGKRNAASKVAEWSVRTLWDRVCHDAIAFAPGKLHPVALEFFDNHPKLLAAVNHVFREDEQTHISGLVPPGHASALLYLMGCSGSKREEYEVRGTEETLDWGQWDKACAFWTAIARKTEEVEPLVELLLDIPEDAGGSFLYHLRCGLCIKGWHQFSRGRKLTEANVAIKTGTDAEGRPAIKEYPLVGGIDLGGQQPVSAGESPDC